MKTAQEKAWAGEFGDAYNKRSPGDEHSNLAFFQRALNRAGDLRSIVELGAGTGANLRALRTLYPEAHLAGVEINFQACQEMMKMEAADRVVNASIGDWEIEHPYQLAFTKGVLIHIRPDQLDDVYAKLYRAALSWILVAEYYNPKMVEVEYRGQGGMLWKRDFAGELLERYPDLRLVDYGFVYHRDAFPQDDLTWFLMEKKL